MINYIRSNRNLLWVGILVLVSIVFLSLASASSSWASFHFETLKNNTNLSQLSDQTYGFWSFLARSGEAMGAYAKMNKAVGKDSVILQVAKDFFGLQSSNGENPQNISSLINGFYGLNAWLQVAAASVGVLLFCLLSLALVLGNLIWRYSLVGKPYNFYRLMGVLGLNVFGFLLFYFLERSMDLEKKRNLMGDNELFLEKKRALMKREAMNKGKDNENVLEVRNLFFSHGGKKGGEYSLKNINLTIKRGSFNVIIGPNGSGKTTLIKALVNLHENIEGEILWNGLEISRIDRTSFSQYVSYIPQILNLDHSISIPDFLRFSRYPYRDPMEDRSKLEDEIIEESVRLGGCEDLAHKTMGELSGGERQRVLLAGILAQRTTEVIVLDEPTSFLDIKNQHIFLERLRKFNGEGRTIIMILHDLHQALYYADNLIVMKDKEVKRVGNPREMVTAELLRDVFSIDCEVVERDGKVEIANICAAEV